jgi:hypothetical protein
MFDYITIALSSLALCVALYFVIQWADRGGN